MPQASVFLLGALTVTVGWAIFRLATRVALTLEKRYRNVPLTAHTQTFKPGGPYLLLTRLVGISMIVSGALGMVLGVVNQIP